MPVVCLFKCSHHVSRSRLLVSSHHHVRPTHFLLARSPHPTFQQPVKAGRSLFRISLDRRQSSSGQKGGLSDDAHLGIRKSSPTFHREAGMTDSPSVHSGAGIHQCSASLGRAICSGPGTVLSHDAAELLDDTAVGPKYRMRRVPRWIRHQLRPIDFAGWDEDGAGRSSAVARNPFVASFFCELKRPQKSHVPVVVGSGLKGSVASARTPNQVTCICSCPASVEYISLSRNMASLVRYECAALVY
ncbi:hypothetical protein C8R46DRAFT_1120252 [Mycena filopes]|nr:hypothetical protein C8R46DRAFT_1120252 [Mycena filopes]